MLIDIDRIVVSDRIRKDFGDIQELADDIKENGLINPPVVNKEYVLLAGERRLRACKMLGWPQIEVRMMDTRDAEHELNIEISENDVRKGFTKSERVDYIKRLLRIEQAKAKENMSAGGQGREISHNLRSDEATAEQFGISSNTMRRELFISDNSDLLDPADFADWDEGKLSTNKAYQRIKAALQQAESERDDARDTVSMVKRVGDELKRQRDEAQTKLAEAREDIEQYGEDIRDLQAEIAALERQNDELYEQANAAQQPQVIERVVESDAAKKRIRELEHLEQLHSSDNQKLRKKNEELRKELDRAKDMLGMDKTLQDVRRDVQYLTNATSQYVRQYGGLTWTAASFEQVEPQAIADLRKAAINLATFANALVASLESFNG